MDAALLIGLGQDGAAARAAAEAVDAAVSDESGEVVRGPLLYSLPVKHDYIEYGHHFGSGNEASNDYFLPTAPDARWNFALEVPNRTDLARSFTFVAGAPLAAGWARRGAGGPKGA